MSAWRRTWRTSWRPPWPSSGLTWMPSWMTWKNYSKEQRGDQENRVLQDQKKKNPPISFFFFQTIFLIKKNVWTAKTNRADTGGLARCISYTADILNTGLQRGR